MILPESALVPAVGVSALTYKYGDRVALERVDFSVGVGEIFALVGPNGGGKTTAFKILSTLLRPTEGTVQVMGHDIVRDAAKVRHAIGVVFQSPALDKKLTVTENLRQQGYLYGMRGRELAERIRELLERIGLSDRGKERAENLSGGLKRRVEIAKGLIHRPAVLILDEPTAGLDPLARREVWTYLAELRRQADMTVLTTTHLLEEAEACDRVAFLDRGKVVTAGTPSALKKLLGGDVISLRCAEPESLKRDIESRFSLRASVLQGHVRIERESGHEFIPELVMAFPDLIQAVTVAKPTLEDLFIQKTGRSLASPAEEGVSR